MVVAFLNSLLEFFLWEVEGLSVPTGGCYNNTQLQNSHWSNVSTSSCKILLSTQYWGALESLVWDSKDTS